MVKIYSYNYTNDEFYTEIMCAVRVMGVDMNLKCAIQSCNVKSYITSEAECCMIVSKKYKTVNYTAKNCSILMYYNCIPKRVEPHVKTLILVLYDPYYQLPIIPVTLEKLEVVIEYNYGAPFRVIKDIPDSVEIVYNNLSGVDQVSFQYRT